MDETNLRQQEIVIDRELIFHLITSILNQFIDIVSKVLL